MHTTAFFPQKDRPLSVVDTHFVIKFNAARGVKTNLSTSIPPLHLIGVGNKKLLVTTYTIITYGGNSER